MTKWRVIFETEPCGRCGGSGRYSYNQMHGDMCYGCHGYGTKLTKAGRAASDLYWSIARPTVSVTELQPGDKLMVEGLAKRGVGTVESVKPDDLNEGMIIVTFSPGAPIGARGAWPTTTFKKAKTRETQAAARAAVTGMKGVTIEEVAD